MKSKTPVRENEERVEEPRAAATRIGTIVRTLPYLLAMLIVSAPLMFAWGSFFVYYNKALEAFGDGRMVEGFWSLLQIALLIILVGFVALTFVLAGKGLSTAAWRLSEGRPILRAGLSSIRFGLVGVLVVAAGVAFFTWSPGKEAADSRTLKESLEEAGTRVATLLGADAETAHAATGEPEAPAEPAEPVAPEPENFSSQAPGKPDIDRPREEERGGDRPAPDGPPKERDDGATGPVPKALDLAVPATGKIEPTPEETEPTPGESVPDETAAPPVVQEELAAEPVEPVVEPPAQSVPPEDAAPPEDGASPEAPPAAVPGLPPKSDWLKYNLPETKSDVPPVPGDPLLP